ncbi:dihydroorotase [Plakobranchus ocellatus]|uniref:Dihydroorotase n=1 Tax=Plakobranchus ocellatus TaxID=259542 RepID=A0AAV4DE27_9GAST|nr:dihydroorotase [Plakobranchus ocellatus]
MPGFVLRNGRVIDPSVGLDAITDVCVTADGHIAGTGSEILGLKVEFKNRETPEQKGQGEQSGWTEIDVTGCLVTPGLIDCHVHAYEHATPLGINLDKTCLARGVTSVLDAGSAGSSTVPGLPKYVEETSQTRLFCLLHIARHGLADAGCVSTSGGGECDSLNVVDVDACVKTISTYRDKIVGVKVRLARMVADNGRNEPEIYRRALQASLACSVPLMTHHSISSIPLGGGTGLNCPGDLRPGDIYTHCFHGQVGNIVDQDTGKVNPYVWKAKKRGVLFDIGHGQGSFSWKVAEQCASEGFWPDIISTDLHTGSLSGPAYDLVAVMSKMLHIGMPLIEVIRAVTETPARAIGEDTNTSWSRLEKKHNLTTGTTTGKDQEIGQLGSGRRADITVLRLQDISKDIEDSQGELRSLQKAFVPVKVFMDGKEFSVTEGVIWPNQESVKACQERTAEFKADDLAREGKGK